jgi:hypothetical protein
MAVTDGRAAVIAALCALTNVPAAEEQPAEAAPSVAEAPAEAAPSAEEAAPAAGA